MEQTLQTVTTTVLPPLITAIVAALGIWLGERRRDRDEIHRRLSAIGEETAHLDYLKSWLEARRLAPVSTVSTVDATSHEVCAELVRSHERLSRALELRPEFNAASPLRRTWQKAVLVPLHRPAARAIGWGYRLWLLLSILTMTLYLTTDYSETDGATFGVILTVAVLLSLPFIGAALGFRAWALALERRRPPNRTTAAPRPTARSWYPRVQAAPAQLAGEEVPSTLVPEAPR